MKKLLLLLILCIGCVDSDYNNENINNAKLKCYSSGTLIYEKEGLDGRCTEGYCYIVYKENNKIKIFRSNADCMVESIHK